LRRQLHKLWTAVRAYRALTAAELAQIVGLALVSYVLLVAAAQVIVVSMGLDLSWTQLGWVRSAVYLLTLVPITIGGMGVRELGFIGFLSVYGIEFQLALALGLTMTAVQLMIGLVGAILELLHHIRR
jgi:uncharacterized protein (TIRG00374 family)